MKQQASKRIGTLLLAVVLCLGLSPTASAGIREDVVIAGFDYKIPNGPSATLYGVVNGGTVIGNETIQSRGSDPSDDHALQTWRMYPGEELRCFLHRMCFQTRSGSSFQPYDANYDVNYSLGFSMRHLNDAKIALQTNVKTGGDLVEWIGLDDNANYGNMSSTQQNVYVGIRVKADLHNVESRAFEIDTYLTMDGARIPLFDPTFMGVVENAPFELDPMVQKNNSMDAVADFALAYGNSETIQIRHGVAGGAQLTDRAVLTAVTPGIVSFSESEVDGGAGDTIVKKPVQIQGLSNGTTDVQVQFYKGSAPVGTPVTFQVTVSGGPAPQPGRKSLAVSAGTGGTVSPSGTSSVAVGDVVAVTATPDANYSFSHWEPSGVTPGGSSFSFQMPDNDVTLNAVFVSARSSSSSSRSRSSDSASSYTAPTEYVINQAEMQNLIALADRKGWAFVRSSSNLPTVIMKNAWALVPEGHKFIARTTADKAVQVQLTFPEPVAIQKDLRAGGYVNGSAVDNRKAVFGKWYTNRVAVIHLEHTGSFGQAVQVAAKVDLDGMDTDNLYIYTYDRKANTVKRITAPDDWIDKNGYIHFTTEYAGDIIISEGLLAKK